MRIRCPNRCAKNGGAARCRYYVIGEKLLGPKNAPGAPRVKPYNITSKKWDISFNPVTANIVKKIFEIFVCMIWEMT